MKYMKWVRYLLFGLLLGSSANLEAIEDKIIVPSVGKTQRNLFSLSDVRLHDSQFKDIQELDHQYLLSLEPDRLLSWFRREAGLTSKAPAYPFWESEDVWGGGPLAGHILGFYLSSMSMMYEATGDERIREKLRYTVEQLAECQQAQGDGYIAASINGHQLLEAGITDGFKVDKAMINGIWEPIYLMNKLMLGLYSTYLSCDLPLAKEVLINLADWFGYKILDKLTHEQIQELLISEHGSINESYIDVYSITGDKKYLNWALLLNDEDMWIPASEKRDVLNGWHANTQIPKFTGFERVYMYTKERKYEQAASFFWKTVVDKHTWIIGGNSTGEHFFPIEEFEKRVTDIGGPESCNSVNMMRLTETLYCNDADMAKVDYYERVLFNHVLANYDPCEGMCTYFTSMTPGHYKIYGTKYHSFWCCTGTGMEAPAKFGKMIYAYSDSDLYVNLFIPSKVNWKSQGVVLEQKTKFPDHNSVEFVVRTTSDVNFTLNIRNPYWTNSNEMSVLINDRKVQLMSNKEGYVCLKRKWKDGDKVVVSLTPEITIEYLKGSNKYAAFMYGPIVLAAKIDNNDLKQKADFRLARRTVASDRIPLLRTYALIGKLKNVPQNVHRENRGDLVFKCTKEVASDAFELIPFNRIHFSRYEVYFPVYKTKIEYENAYSAAKEEIIENDFLESHTVDRVRLESSDSEIEHKQDGINTSIGDSYGCTWRHAADGGYFMYQMAVVPKVKQSICMKFIRTDHGNRVFDVLVDGHVIATLDHCQPKNTPRLFYYEMIPIPDTLISNKKFVTVKLHARKGNIAGGVFDLRILKRE